jgi:serine/threonine protein phosphatase 1
MRTLAIGDIHGCATALHTLLEAVRPGRDDVLITLGDYVDRGPDSNRVLETLIKLESQTQLKPLIGNHEILFLDALARRIDPEGWLRVGGSETLRSYSPDHASLSWELVNPAHVEFLTERCLRYFEDEKHLYVHANANAYFSLADQTDDWLFWTRFDDAYPHVSGKMMICGHTAQKSGLPTVKPSALCLDTWAYGQGWLTCLHVESGDLIQANQSGQIRRMTLADLPSAQEPATTRSLTPPASPES